MHNEIITFCLWYILKRVIGQRETKEILSDNLDDTYLNLTWIVKKYVSLHQNRSSLQLYKLKIRINNISNKIETKKPSIKIEN